MWWQLPSNFGLPAFSGGAGEPNDPYLISTATQLNSIGNNPRLINGHFKLVEDLDLTGVAFYPIGSDRDVAYHGVFDGDGHTISHMTLRSPATYDYNSVGTTSGMFGTVGSDAVVKNIVLVDVEPGEAWYNDTAGGLVGHNQGYVTGCYVTGLVRGYPAGGLVGHNSGRIDTCHSASTVMLSGSGGVLPGGLGGLVGFNDGNITASCSEGAIAGDAFSVGGLVGHNDGNITGSCSSATVSGYCWVGGLVGWNEGSVTDCYASGSVTGSDGVGGLVGKNGYSSFDPGTIENCYSTGVVCSSGDLTGGLAGSYELGEIMFSFWDVDTSGQTTGAGSTGLTTAEMQTASTFLDAGWDFIDETDNGTDDIWWILEGQDYPRLWWELPEEDG